MNQWVEWPDRPAPEYEVPNIDWLIAVFTGNKQDDGNTGPSIKSWAKKAGTLKYILKYIRNIKGALVFCPYRWPNELKEFSSSSAHKEWKYDQGIIHNTYHVENI